MYTVVIFLLLARRTHNREEGALVLFFAKVCVASALVATVCYKLRRALEPYLAWHTLPGAFSLLVAVTAVGILLLVIVGKLLGIRELDEQLARLWLLAPWRRSKTPA